jgi:hypothetical protein
LICKNEGLCIKHRIFCIIEKPKMVQIDILF